MKTVVFQGDSITDSVRSRELEYYSGNGYATMVKGFLGAEHPGQYRFFNRGVSGDRIADLYARIKADMINLAPDYMSILVGVNDVWHELRSQNGTSPEKFEMVYGLIIEELQQALPHLQLLLMEPFILPGQVTEHLIEDPDCYAQFRAGVTEMAAAVRRVAERYQLVFVPLQERFDRAARLAPPDYWLWDGVHPTQMGHELIKRAWLEGFAQLK